ncbi:MFS transporter [Brevibacillus ruminantium]|uniref:MFS transporter n=1 Tax=Brevibacillus ruminantium TaxID=2950604 RepID=UPI003898FE7D
MRENHTALKREKLWTKKFVLLTLCNLFLFLNLQMMTPAFPAYVTDRFGASDFQTSLVISLFAFSAVITRIFTGKALQTKKSLTILLLGITVVLLATAGYIWSGSLMMLFVMRVLFGAGFGMTSTTFPTLAANVIPNQRMGEGMGYFGLSSSLAMSIAPVIGLFILGKFGFTALSVSAIVLVIAILPLLRAVQPESVSRTTAHQPQAQATDTNSRIPRIIWLPAFLNLLLGITYGGLISFLALFGKEVQIENVGWFFLCNAGAMVLIRPVSGKLFDKLGHWAVLPPGALCAVIGLLILPHATNVQILLLAALFYGLGYGTIQPSIQAWMIKEVSPSQRGIANGLFLNSIDLGIALGAMLLGVIASATSYSAMFGWSSLCMVLFLVIYLAYQLVWRRVKQPIAGKEMNA